MGWASRGSFIVSCMSIGLSFVGYQRWWERRKKTKMLESNAWLIALEDLNKEKFEGEGFAEGKSASKKKDKSLMYGFKLETGKGEIDEVLEGSDGWL